MAVKSSEYELRWRIFHWTVINLIRLPQSAHLMNVSFKVILWHFIIWWDLNLFMVVTFFTKRWIRVLSANKRYYVYYYICIDIYTFNVSVYFWDKFGNRNKIFSIHIEMISILHRLMLAWIRNAHVKSKSSCWPNIELFVGNTAIEP